MGSRVRQSLKRVERPLDKISLTQSYNSGRRAIHLLILQQAVASTLVRNSEDRKLPVYFVSCILRGAEVHYSQIEKLAYAFVVSTRKLHSYFESHTIVVYTNYPLKHVFHKLDQSQRMLQWSIELCGYNLKFAPRTAIKAQALLDFLA